MRLLAGTSGYSYKEWVGSFYPPKLPAARMLNFYASRLPAVEVNNSFYRTPSRDLLERWAAEVPETFRFVLKAPKRITHDRKLQQVEDPVAFLLDVSAALGPRRGPFLFQLPPTFKKDLPRLRDLLALLGGVPAAVEFRHASWHDEEVYQALREGNASLCWADTEEERTPLVPTAPFGYLRLRRQDYDDAALAEWVERVRAPGWAESYVFFKHEDEAAGPRLAARFLELAGEPSPA